MLKFLNGYNKITHHEPIQAEGPGGLPANGAITQYRDPDPVETEVSTTDVSTAEVLANGLPANGSWIVADPAPVPHADGWSDVGTTARRGWTWRTFECHSFANILQLIGLAWGGQQMTLYSLSFHKGRRTTMDL